MGGTIKEFEFNGNMIPPPLNGKIYQPLEAAELITALTGKRTKVRGQLINLILSKKAVKGRTALYDTIKAYEEGRPFSVVWKERNKKSSSLQYHNCISVMRSNLPSQPPISNIADQINHGCRTGCIIDRESEYTCHYGKRDFQHIVKDGWRGSIYLNATCVSIQSINRGLLSQEDLTKPSHINICDALGKCVRVDSDGDTDHDIDWRFDSLRADNVLGVRVRNVLPGRLYFSPIEFPPPTDNMDEGGSNNTFSRLKNYIIVSSGSLENGSNSPVVCKGGDRKYRNKVFRCKNYKHSHCPLSFTVSWDEYGYFIYLSKGLLYTFGCPWHCCKREGYEACSICYEIHLPHSQLEQHMKTCKRKSTIERIQSGELKGCDICGCRITPLAMWEIKEMEYGRLKVYKCTCKTPVVSSYTDENMYFWKQQKAHQQRSQTKPN